MADRPGFLPVASYLRLPREHEAFLVKPLIPTSGAALLYGTEKTGKTYLAIQLALAISGDAHDWLGFPITRHGSVLMLQLDTPRSTMSLRLYEMQKSGAIPASNTNFMVADRECLEHYPFDVLNPQHVKYLWSIVQPLHPAAVIVDTLRESHSGDENDATTARNVIANLVGATHPAALIIVSHSRKPYQDSAASLMADHRGSSYITGRMDAILRLTKSKLYYTGRSIEEGDIKLQRLDNGMWAPGVDIDAGPALAAVLADTSIPSLRAKARVLGPRIGKSEEAAMSLIRRTLIATNGAALTEPTEVLNDPAEVAPEAPLIQAVEGLQTNPSTSYQNIGVNSAPHENNEGVKAPETSVEGA